MNEEVNERNERLVAGYQNNDIIGFLRNILQTVIIDITKQHIRQCNIFI